MERVKSIGVQNALHGKHGKAVVSNACAKVKREFELWKAFELDWQVDCHAGLHKDKDRRLGNAA